MANELNRANVSQNLGPIVGDTRNLSYDMRTTLGKQAQNVYNTQADTFYKPTEWSQSFEGASFQPELWNDDGSAAFGISEETGFSNPVEIPTSSTNYSRPRTVAAAYDPSRQTMTVVFRDGTFYNYYTVTQDEWIAFRASYSKGRPWLNRGNPTSQNPGAQRVDGLFISKPRGPIDADSIDPRIRQELYRVARVQQTLHGPKKGRTTTTWNQTGNQPGTTVKAFREGWTTSVNQRKVDINRKTAGNKPRNNGNRKAS